MQNADFTKRSVFN